MTGELAQLLAGGGIPDAGGLVSTGGDDGLAVRAVRRRVDTAAVAVSWRSSSPVAASQMRAVRSPLAVTMVLPSGLYAAELTASLWPVSSRSSSPVAASQMRAVWSPLAVTMLLPSGLYAAELTEPLWPVSWRSSSPVAASQMRAVWSSLAVTMVLPSGLYAAELTESLWP